MAAETEAIILRMFKQLQHVRPSPNSSRQSRCSIAYLTVIVVVWCLWSVAYGDMLLSVSWVWYFSGVSVTSRKSYIECQYRKRYIQSQYRRICTRTSGRPTTVSNETLGGRSSLKSECSRAFPLAATRRQHIASASLFSPCYFFAQIYTYH